MSSSYPPFGNAPVQQCQRCGKPLSPSEITCGNCGYYNAPSSLNSNVPQSPSSMPWNGASPQASQAWPQNGGQQWGQTPIQPSQNSQLGDSVMPPRPFSLSSRSPGSGNFMGIPRQDSSTSNLFGMPSQQPDGGSPFGATSQAPNTGPFYNSSAPPQTFASQPLGDLEQRGRNGFQTSGFGQAPSSASNGWQPGNTNGFQITSSGQSPSQTLPGQVQQGGFHGYGQAPSQPLGNGFQSTGFGALASQPLTEGFQAGSTQQGTLQGYPSPAFSQPRAKKRRSKIGLIIVSVLLIVLVVAAGIGGYELLKKNKANPTAQATATTAPTAIPKGAPLFQDTFSNNKSGWDTTSKAGQYSVKIGNGSMVLEDDNNRLLWELVPGSRNFNDFLLTVDANLSKGTQGNGYGIYIRGASNQNAEIATYYRFELYGDSTYAVFKGTVDSTGTSKSTPIVNFSTNSAVLKQGQVNHIGISARGTKMTFTVNGHTLATISDNSYTGGSIALFVSNLENNPPGAQATFTNLFIYPPQS